MKKIIALALACLFSGCMSPDLCGLKGTPLKIEKISTSDKPCAETLQTGIQLKEEYIRYFADNPTNDFEEAYNTLAPLGHKHEFLKKKDDGYSYYLNVSLLGGLLIHGRGVFEFNKDGTPNSCDLSMNTFSGLLSDGKAQFYLNKSDGAVHGNFSIHQSILSGLLYSRSKYCDLNHTIKIQDWDMICKAFGFSKSKEGSRFLTFLWVPIKISEPVK
jgi:hypothetical protein